LCTLASRNGHQWPYLNSFHPELPLFRLTYHLVTAFLLLPLLILTTAALAPAIGPEKIVIREISIKGNQKIEEATIRYKMKTKVGDEFSVETLREDVKTLYNMGYFDQVSVDGEGFEGGLMLTVLVQEKPYVKEIEIQGNKA